MADWIPMQIDLSRRAEVIKIAEKCGFSRHQVVGMLLDLWGWFSSETIDGRVDTTVDALTTAIGLPIEFTRSVVGVGWIKESGRFVSISNWDRWLSKSAKSRVQKTLRQKVYRKSVDAHVDGRASTTVQNNRVHNKEIKKKETLEEKNEARRLRQLAKLSLPPAH